MTILELPDEDSGPTCRTFKFLNNSPSLFSNLKIIINNYDDVIFCDYTIPHHAESNVKFRIQSNTTPAAEILKRGLTELAQQVDDVTDLCEHAIDAYEKGFTL